MLKLHIFLSVVFANILLSFTNFVSVQAQEEFREASVEAVSYLAQITPKMVTIPAGLFKVGCVDSLDCKADDPSDRWVDMQPFLMSEHEVTWDMYQPCIDVGACPDNSIDGGDNGWGKGDRPVINVNWFDITELYIPWLNDQTGKSYRLPTHEEWEYAARGGTITAYHWGDEVGSNRANCAGCGSKWDGEMSAPVKSFSPNDFGLYDMHGNVSEWTKSCFRGPYGRLEENCDSRVMPSGAFASLPWTVSVSAFGGKALYRRGVYGIRLVQDIQQHSALR